MEKYARAIKKSDKYWYFTKSSSEDHCGSTQLQPSIFQQPYRPIIGWDLTSLNMPNKTAITNWYGTFSARRQIYRSDFRDGCSIWVELDIELKQYIYMQIHFQIYRSIQFQPVLINQLIWHLNGVLILSWYNFSFSISSTFRNQSTKTFPVF